MVTWGCSAIGDLAGADVASADGLAQVQPGQEPGQTLHLTSWRIYTLTLMGRWDAIAPLAQRARHLWEEMERETAGYALRGFVAATHIAQSRGETALAASLFEVVELILREFKETDSRHGAIRARWLPLLVFDRTGLENATAAWTSLKGLPDSLERLISAMSDRLWTIPADVTTSQLDWAQAAGLRPLEVQLRRAVGLRDGNERELIRAAEIAESIGAASPLARVRHELARMNGDSAGMAAAIAILEAMGDNGQIGLYQG